MDEIRFNRPPVFQQEDKKPDTKIEVKAKPKSNIIKNFFKVVGLLLVIVVLVGAALWGIQIFRNNESVNGNTYSAVFLNNGQVYFGKIVKNSKTEIVMNEVFYIQANEVPADNQVIVDGQNNGSVGPQTSFNLIRMANELHGPTDTIFINKLQVVFYENLRDDSQIVQAIKGQINN